MAIQLHQPVARRHRMGLPAARADHHVARRRSRGSADAITSPTVSPVITSPGLTGCGIGLLLAQPAAHIRIDRQPDRAGDHLAGGRRGDGVLADLEILAARTAVGTTLQHDRAADCGILAHHALRTVEWCAAILRLPGRLRRFPYGIVPNFAASAGVCWVFAAAPMDRSSHPCVQHQPPQRRPRTLAIAERADAPQPAAILVTLGLIGTLLLTWVGMATGWPALH